MKTKTLLVGAGFAAGAWWLLRPRAPFPPLLRSRERGARTAVVTGASAGLGAEFARQLAGRGYRLVLVARRADRLEALAQEITATYGVPAEVLAADLATPEGLAAVEERLRSLDTLEVLINNAGFGTVGRLSKSDLARQQQMVDLHVTASMRLTYAALAGMAGMTTGRKCGAVVNVASVAAFAPLPGNVNYSATKSYLVTFCEALQAELDGSGVYVQALCPGYTHTEFHSTEDFGKFDKTQSPAWIWMDAPDVVRASLNDLGSGRAVVVPGWMYKILATLLRTPGVGELMLRIAGRIR